MSGDGVSDGRRVRLREAIAGDVDPLRLPGLETILDRIELVLDELDAHGLHGFEDALVDAARDPHQPMNPWPVGAFEPSLVRRAIDELLRRHPHLDVVRVDWQRPAEPALELAQPWVLVDLGQPSAGVLEAFAIWPFAIWKSTGAVYAIGADGAVGDDPLFELEL